MKYVIIIGTGGFASEVLWLVQEINRSHKMGGRVEPSYRVLGFIAEEGEEQFAKDMGGLPVLGDDAWAFEHLERNVCFVPAVGDPAMRKKIAEKYIAEEFRPIALVHPSVNMADDVRLGRGTLLCAGAVLTTHIHLGDFSIVNLNATIGHNCTFGDYCTVHPGVNVSGGVTLGNEIELGTGSTLIQGVSLEDHTVVGAGAVVTKDLPGGKTYIGIPARPLD